MLNVTKELTALARKLGYTGEKPDTVAKAIDAITSVAGEGGGCDYDPGYKVVDIQLFNETVTTVELNGMCTTRLAYSQLINADTIVVTFDGTEYTCQRINNGSNANYYGGASEQGPVFTEYPFVLRSSVGENRVFTAAADECTIAVTISSLQTSADFDKARGYGYVTSSPTELFNETVTTEDDGSGVYEGHLAYTGDLNTDAIIVTYDGTEYECHSISPGEYGAPYSINDGFDFSVYPFNLYKDSDFIILVTQTAGEHTVAATAVVTSMEISADFDSAVTTVARPIVDQAIAAIPTPVTPFIALWKKTTWNEVNNAIKSGRPVFMWKHSDAANASDMLEPVITTTYNGFTVTTLTLLNSTVSSGTYRASTADGALN